MSHGAKVLNINLKVDRHDIDTDFFIEGPAGKMVPEWISDLL